MAKKKSRKKMTEKEFQMVLLSITLGKPRACTVIQELFDHYAGVDAEGGARLLAKILMLGWQGDQLWKIYKECGCDMLRFKQEADEQFDKLAKEKGTPLLRNTMFMGGCGDA